MIPLKFRLDRRSLEIMYNSFVLPTMEYANVVWGGTYDSDILKLERIHVDGMRLITGATARSNIANLYDETSWRSISDRCDTAMLIMMFKVKNNLCPEYLSQLLPPENIENRRYNLRNNEDIRIPATNLESFKRSFIPHAISLWNNLPLAQRQIPTLEDFKLSLKENFKECNILYYYGKRWPSIHHSRIRIGCSKLKNDLFSNLRVIDEPYCICGSIEDANHFFFGCPNYIDLRLNLFSIVAIYSQINLEILLHGNAELSEDINVIIFDAVHDYIEKSNRFV
mgnify:CR=1 FL=1